VAKPNAETVTRYVPGGTEPLKLSGLPSPVVPAAGEDRAVVVNGPTALPLLSLTGLPLGSVIVTVAPVTDWPVALSVTKPPTTPGPGDKVKSCRVEVTVLIVTVTAFVVVNPGAEAVTRYVPGGTEPL